MFTGKSAKASAHVGADPTATGRNLSPLLLSFLAAGLRFARGIIVARLLGPAGRGQLTTVISVVQPAARVAAGGVGPAVGFAMKTGRISSAAANGFVVRQVSFVLTCATGTLLVLNVLGPKLPNLAVQAMSTALLISIVATNGFRGARIAESRVRWVFMVGVLSAAVALALSALVSEFSHEDGLEWILGAITTGFILGAVAMSLPWRFERQRTGVRSVVGNYGLKAMPASLFQFGTNKFDQLIVVMAAGFEVGGIYALAVSLNQAFPQIGQVFATRAFASCQPGVHTPRQDLQRVLMMAWPLVGGCAVSTAIAVPILVNPVFGEEFGPAEPAALLLIPGSILLVASSVALQVCLAHGRPTGASTSEGVGFGVGAAATVLLTPRFGAVGAAIASNISYLARLGTLSIVLFRPTPRRLT